MSDNRDEKLEKMLGSRRFEPARADLAERIILKAQTLPQSQTVPLRQWVRQLFAEFHLPKPAYVLACALLLGFVVGINTPVDRFADNSDTVSLQSFLYADEDLL